MSPSTNGLEDGDVVTDREAMSETELDTKEANLKAREVQAPRPQTNRQEKTIDISAKAKEGATRLPTSPAINVLRMASPIWYQIFPLSHTTQTLRGMTAQEMGGAKMVTQMSRQ